MPGEVNTMNLVYQAKPGKPRKEVILPGTQLHEVLAVQVATAQNLLTLGDEKTRNYLSGQITFVVSDCGHEPGGKHGRTSISFPIKIPDREIFTGADVRTTYAESGFHTEQMIYQFLQTPEGLKYLMEAFKQAEAEAVQSRTLRPIKDGFKRKVYAMVLDFHSRFSMCEQPQGDMNQSCAGATLREMRVGKKNMRYATAQCFLQEGYTVSGYDSKTGEPKSNKIRLKMGVRVSYFDPHGSHIDQPHVEPVTINHRNDNNVVLSKRLPKPTELDPSKIPECTIFKSSKQSGFAQSLEEARGEALEGNRAWLSKLAIAFPSTFSKGMNLSLASCINNDQYPEALELMTLGAKLMPSHYGARNKKDVPFVCYPDPEGYTALWGAIEGGDKKQFDEMVKGAKLSEPQILAATHYDTMQEVNSRFEFAKATAALAKMHIHS